MGNTLTLDTTSKITGSVLGAGSFDGEFSDRSRMLTGKGGLKANW